jgi:hypothetical protein
MPIEWKEGRKESMKKKISEGALQSKKRVGLLANKNERKRMLKEADIQAQTHIHAESQKKREGRRKISERDGPFSLWNKKDKKKGGDTWAFSCRLG